MQLLAEQSKSVQLPLVLLLPWLLGVLLGLRCWPPSVYVPDTWSHILSGWPSVTDSDVNRNVCGTLPWPAAAAAVGETCSRRVCAALLLGCTAVRRLLLPLLLQLLSRLLPADSMGNLESKREMGSMHHRLPTDHSQIKNCLEGRRGRSACAAISCGGPHLPFTDLLETAVRLHPSLLAVDD
jgi:hypothetical protein